MRTRTLRLIRRITFAANVILALGIAAVELAPKLRELAGPGETATAAADTVAVPAGVPIGGPFKLADDKGHIATDADYRSRWMLVFFGYSNCPDECPLTLQKMAIVLNALGSLANCRRSNFIASTGVLCRGSDFATKPCRRYCGRCSARGRTAWPGPHP
jgi:cytochrome oxidase Cu insertion factor (SCO1/SenC/PrrC family)